MYNVNDYLENKKELITKMEVVKTKITELSYFGIDVNESIEKIENAEKMVKEDKISVVLLGAFSDGKTSVVAGWINEKLDNMKISADESSDEILCYTPNSMPEGCRIVDTPGLFGDKVGSDECGNQISLSDKTKKFISEANLILYVVAAKNPIKDSHKECVKWILKDLNKISSTIFVINRMDDVADLTDEEDFELQAHIKTENLRKKLEECGLSLSEAETAKVVCISAAPNGKSIEVWNEHREEYLKRSHLSALEKMTNSILSNSKERLITKTGCDVLNDEIMNMLEILNTQEKQINEIIIPEKKECLRRNQKDLETLKKKLKRSKADLKSDLKALMKRKISRIRAASLENFRSVMEDEIGLLPGKEGYILNDEINDIFKQYFDLYSGWTMNLGEKFQAEYSKQNEAIEYLLKKGVNGVADGLKGVGHLGVDTFKSGIVAGRDLLGKIGVVVKFKPWQVTKIASFATKALPLIGAGIDIVTNVIDNFSTQKKNDKFEKNKEEIKDAIEEIFYELIEMLADDEKFFDKFAPQYHSLQEQLRQDQNNIEEQEDILGKFESWKKDIIDVDFKIV